MDESALTLGTIDVSYLPNSSEYSVGRCKHANEEWVSVIQVRNIQPKDVPVLFMKVAGSNMSNRGS